ncbi:MAG: D-alanyl-D-alanine carboxypeptidase [Angelakisella sp.]|nr:D-alanyl-D-alanine carboxypeptidase [Angelakisella sp.]MCI9529483.1 D-alanyl-D-alanine carboxypeptidase [Angelakisella sp.]
MPEEAVVAAVTEADIEAEKALAAAITPGVDLPVKSAVLMDQGSGTILYAENEDVQLPPASITKVMSLLLVMEAIDSGKISLTDKVVCSDTAAAYGGSQIWLKPGEEMTVDDLLKAAAISSANDATVCLAEYVAGSEEAFIGLMNQRAAELGMANTTFRCAAGLDQPGHLSTAKDVAIMSRALLGHPLILNYSTVWMDSLRGGETQLVNTNRMIRFYQGATGLKTGTTSGAGSCLAASASRDGLGLIAVVMGADTSDHRFAAARSLLDWGFANFMQAKLTPPEDILPVPVTGGVERQVEVICQPPEGILIEKGKLEAITQDVILPESVAAPVAAGQELGSIAVCVEGERVSEYPILAAEPVERMSFGKALSILFMTLIAMS